LNANDQSELKFKGGQVKCCNLLFC